ncbi:hypothetical protein FB446DRAFT_708137 [Lentinula raphanica]|nr:hypothetical protein FB446DRAFT_708137 [Lentinula raphanica]
MARPSFVLAMMDELLNIRKGQLAWRRDWVLACLSELDLGVSDGKKEAEWPLLLAASGPLSDSTTTKKRQRQFSGKKGNKHTSRPCSLKQQRVNDRPPHEIPICDEVENFDMPLATLENAFARRRYRNRRTYIDCNNLSQMCEGFCDNDVSRSSKINDFETRTDIRDRLHATLDGPSECCREGAKDATIAGPLLEVIRKEDGERVMVNGRNNGLALRDWSQEESRGNSVDGISVYRLRRYLQVHFCFRRYFEQPRRPIFVSRTPFHKPGHVDDIEPDAMSVVWAEESVKCKVRDGRLLIYGYSWRVEHEPEGQCKDNKYDEDKEDVGQEYNTSKMRWMRYGYARGDEETFRLWRAGRPNVTES